MAHAPYASFCIPERRKMDAGPLPRAGNPKIPKGQRMDEKILEEGEKIITKAFEKKDRLTSKEMYAKMDSSGIPALKKHEVQAHILRRAGRDGIVCYASHDGGQPTFALLDQWITKREVLSRDQPC